MGRASSSGTVAGMTWVTVGAMTANALSYVMHLVAGRLLLPDGYGMFASLVTAQLVLAVPALALQSVIARSIARNGRYTARDGRQLTYRIAAAVAVLGAAATPALAAVLHTPVGAAAAAMAMAPLLVLLAGEQGVLQGRERFGALAALLAAAGAGKALPAVAVLAAGAGATGALAASAAGTAAAVLAARAAITPSSRSGTDFLPHPLTRSDERIRQKVSGTIRGAAGAPATGAAVLRASQVQLVLIALTSVDLIMARAVLTEHDAGLYAMGAVATKAAFWLPAAVGVVLYPRMSRPEHSLRAVRATLAVLTGLGAVVVAVAAAASPLVPVVVGGEYRPITGMLWLFALEGAALAVLQGALLSTIARGATRLAALAWAGLIAEGIALGFADSVTRMLVTAAVCALGTTVAVTVAVVLSLRGGGVGGSRAGSGSGAVSSSAAPSDRPTPWTARPGSSRRSSRRA